MGEVTDLLPGIKVLRYVTVEPHRHYMEALERNKTFPLMLQMVCGHAVAQFVYALGYVPESRGFVSRMCH